MTDVTFQGYLLMTVLGFITLILCLYGVYKSKSRGTPPLSIPQQLKQGKNVTLEDCYSYIDANFSPEQKKQFVKDLDRDLFPIFVKKLLEFKDKGEISADEFERDVRRLVEQIGPE